MSFTRVKDITTQIDGVATIFTVPEVYDSGTVSVFLNGIKLKPGLDVGIDDYVEVSPTFNTVELCSAPRVGDTLQVMYEVNGPVLSFPLVQAYASDPDWDS